MLLSQIENFYNCFNLKINKYLLLKNALNDQVVNTIGKSIYDGFKKSEKKGLNHKSRIDNIGQFRKKFVMSKNLKKLGFKENYFLDIILNSKLGDLLKKTFSEKFIILNNNLNFPRFVSQKYKDSLLPYHQDGVIGEDFILRTWIPLFPSNFGVESPTIEIVKYRDKNLIKRSDASTSRYYSWLELDENEIEKIIKKKKTYKVICNQGDVFLFYGFIPHRSFVDNSHVKERVSIEPSFISFSNKNIDFLENSKTPYTVFGK